MYRSFSAKALKKKDFPTIWHLVQVFFIFVLTTLLSAGIFVLLLFLTGNMDFSQIENAGAILYAGNILPWFLGFSYIFPMLLTIWITQKRFGIKPPLHFHTTGLGYFPLVFMAWFFMLIFIEGIMRLLPSPGDEFWVFSKLIESSPVMGFLLLAVAAPLLEEILFRGIILRFLLKKMSPWKAIMISALAFGIFHLNIWQFTGAFIMGIFFGFLFWKTGSLFYPVLFHFINNALAYLLVMKYGSVDKNLTDVASVENGAVYVLSGILFAGLMYYLNRIFDALPQRLYLASGNPHKMEEIQSVLPENIKLLSYKTLKKAGALKETGKTLEENALQKALQVSRVYGVDVLSDDTGLEVEALNGEPGVYSARYAGEQAQPEDNRRKLLEELQDKDDRRAQFRTVLVLDKGHQMHLFEGEVKGEITKQETGEGGFGYDPVFKPEGYEITFAEMDLGEKNKISHRGRALQKLVDFLKANRK